MLFVLFRNSSVKLNFTPRSSNSNFILLSMLLNSPSSSSSSSSITTLSSPSSSSQPNSSTNPCSKLRRISFLEERLHLHPPNILLWVRT